MKRSKLERKYLNQMRQLSEVPWPARRYKIAPTFSAAAAKTHHVGTCQRKVAEQMVPAAGRLGKFKPKQQVDIVCGGRLIAKLGSLGKRRVFCEECRSRKAQQKLVRRLEQKASRLGAVSPAEQAQEERRSVKMLQRFRRAGAR